MKNVSTDISKVLRTFHKEWAKGDKRSANAYLLSFASIRNTKGKKHPNMHISNSDSILCISIFFHCSSSFTIYLFIFSLVAADFFGMLKINRCVVFPRFLLLLVETFCTAVQMSFFVLLLLVWLNLSEHTLRVQCQCSAMRLHNAWKQVDRQFSSAKCTAKMAIECTYERSGYAMLCSYRLKQDGDEVLNNENELCSKRAVQWPMHRKECVCICFRLIRISFSPPLTLPWLEKRRMLMWIIMLWTENRALLLLLLLLLLLFSPVWNAKFLRPSLFHK